MHVHTFHNAFILCALSEQYTIKNAFLWVIRFLTCAFCLNKLGMQISTAFRAQTLNRYLEIQHGLF